MTAQAIGFIGLGDMGYPMAKRLLEHGFTVVSCAHRRREAIEALKPDGLVEVENPAAVAQHAELVFTIVLDAQQTDRVLHGEDGVLGTLPRGGVIVIMSTLTPSYCSDLAAALTEREISVLDCPVSGGSTGAQRGTDVPRRPGRQPRRPA